MPRLHALLVAVLAASLAGCFMSVSLEGSGFLVTQEEPLAGFDRVEASHAFDVDVVQGAAFSVIVETDDNVVEHLDVRVEGDTLVLGLKRGSYSLRDVTLRADVTLPALTGIELSGASRAHLTDIDTPDRFRASCSGASSLDGRLRAGDAEFGLSGASRVELTGGCDTLDLGLSGASNAQLLGFTAREADVSASGASQVRLHATDGLTVNASGASHVTYAGDPKLRGVQTSGVSSLSSTSVR